MQLKHHLLLKSLEFEIFKVRLYDQLLSKFIAVQLKSKSKLHIRTFQSAAVRNIRSMFFHD